MLKKYHQSLHLHAECRIAQPSKAEVVIALNCGDKSGDRYRWELGRCSNSTVFPGECQKGISSIL